ncbi:MAG: hypothetical protein ACXV44_08585 [Halobacteriota archaeon]
MTSPLALNRRAQRIIDVRDLVWLDMALHGDCFIITEFALATVFGITLGLLVLFAGTPKGSLSVISAAVFFFGSRSIPLPSYSWG